MEEVGLEIHNKRVAHEEQKCKEELEKDELDMRKKHKREALLYWLADQKKYNFELLISSDYWKRHTASQNEKKEDRNQATNAQNHFPT